MSLDEEIHSMYTLFKVMKSIQFALNKWHLSREMNSILR